MCYPLAPHHPLILMLSSSFSENIWGASQGAISNNFPQYVAFDHILYIVGWKVVLLVLLPQSYSHSTSCFSTFSVALVVLLTSEDFFVASTSLPQGIVLEYWPHQLSSV
jgi:hypothetical protein